MKTKFINSMFYITTIVGMLMVLSIKAMVLNATSLMILKLLSKKISNDQELIKSDPTSCPINQKGNN